MDFDHLDGVMLEQNLIFLTLEYEHIEVAEAFESSYVEVVQLEDYQFLLSSFGVADLRLEVPNAEVVCKHSLSSVRPIH